MKKMRNSIFVPVFENENEEDLVFSGELDSNGKILSISVNLYFI